MRATKRVPPFFFGGGSCVIDAGKFAAVLKLLFQRAENQQERKPMSQESWNDAMDG